MREIVRASKALSDEIRIRMLKLLLEKDICIGEMQEIFPLSKSQVSRNLKMLMDAGFLKRWREGKCIVYEADRDNTNPYCRALLDALAASLNDSEAVSGDREKMRQVIAQQIREREK